ncbi:MAG: sensor histidine kinase, partial [Limisphaerales bacterium]
DLPFERLDVGHQVELVLAEFADEIERTHAEITCGHFPFVYSNATVLRQILVNLIGNALKFVLPQQTPKIEISAEQSGKKVRLFVKDNGIGIDDHHRHRIFEVFQRLHTHDDYPGTGIGLAIVAKGVQRLGGSVGVESEPGKGSTFWIELPSEPGGE